MWKPLQHRRWRTENGCSELGEAMRHLGLSGAPNTRDLGGLRTTDGRCVKPGMLIRSGELSRLTESDVGKLQGIGLKTVVDFRTAYEQNEKPDVPVPGAQHVDCPILEQMTGITREQSGNEIPPYYRAAIQAGKDAANRMAGLYLPLVEGEYSLTHYAQFLKIVLAHENGALLYHCTAGKDRVGVATMLILSALGVSRGAILEDYLLTNGYLAAEVDETVRQAKRYSDDPDLEFAVRAFEAASEQYMRNAWDSIDRNYGSTEAFLAQRLGFGAHETVLLREKYLT